MDTYKIFAPLQNLYEYADLRVKNHIAWHSSARWNTLNSYQLHEPLVLYKNDVAIDVLYVDSIDDSGLTNNIIALSPMYGFKDFSVIYDADLNVNDLTGVSLGSVIFTGLAQLFTVYHNPAKGIRAHVTDTLKNTLAFTTTVGMFPISANSSQQISQTYNAELSNNVAQISMMDAYTTLLRRGYKLIPTDITIAPNDLVRDGDSNSLQNIPHVTYHLQYIGGGGNVGSLNIVTSRKNPVGSSAEDGLLLANSQRIVDTAGGIIKYGGVLTLINRAGGTAVIPHTFDFDAVRMYNGGNPVTPLANNLRVNDADFPRPSKNIIRSVAESEMYAGQPLPDAWDVTPDGTTVQFPSNISDYTSEFAFAYYDRVFMADSSVTGLLGQFLTFRGNQLLITETFDNLFACTDIITEVFN